jgi:hypothetical protein
MNKHTETLLYPTPYHIYQSDEDLANAHFMIKCVNNHDKLVEALKAIQEWLLFKGEIKPDEWNEQFVKANNLVIKVLSQIEKDSE